MFVHNIVEEFNKTGIKEIRIIDNEKRNEFEGKYARRVVDLEHVVKRFSDELLKYAFNMTYNTIKKQRKHISKISMTAKEDAEAPHQITLEITCNANYQEISFLITTAEVQTDETVISKITEVNNAYNTCRFDDFTGNRLDDWLAKLLRIALVVQYSKKPD